MRLVSAIAACEASDSASRCSGACYVVDRSVVKTFFCENFSRCLENSGRAEFSYHIFLGFDGDAHMKMTQQSVYYTERSLQS
jgi:hypothetical protein